MSKRKAPGERLDGGEKTTNQKISDFLWELANYEKNVNRGKLCFLA